MILMVRTTFFAVGFLFLVSLVAPVTAAPKSSELVQAELVADVSAVRPGEAFTVGVRFKIAPQWHIYWKHPGDSGSPTRVRLELPEGFQAGDVQYPVPDRFDQAEDILGYGYSGEVMLLVPVMPPQKLDSLEEVRIGANVSWLSCEKVCIPGRAKLDLTLPIARDDQQRYPNPPKDLFAEWGERMPVAARQSPDCGAVMVSVLEDGRHQIVLQWRSRVRDVQWFAAPPSSLAVDDTKIEQQGNKTTITFQPRMLAGQTETVDRLPSVAGYVDETNHRRGISIDVPITERSKS